MCGNLPVPTYSRKDCEHPVLNSSSCIIYLDLFSFGPLFIKNGIDAFMRFVQTIL